VDLRIGRARLPEIPTFLGDSGQLLPRRENCVAPAELAGDLVDVGLGDRERAMDGLFGLR
jgi:hypothetical protein